MVNSLHEIGRSTTLSVSVSETVSHSFVMVSVVSRSEFALVIILTFVVTVCLQSYDSVMIFLKALQQKLGSLAAQRK